MSNPLVPLKVPSVGESVTEVEIGEWLKPLGGFVGKDEPLVMLETDKATMELPSPVAGILKSIAKNRGERVTVGQVIGEIEPGEAPAATSAPPPATTSQPAEAPSPKPEVKPDKPVKAARVMPAAARLAAETGVSLDDVKPTGPGGRVLKEDVQRAVAEPVKPPAAPATEPLLREPIGVGLEAVATAPTIPRDRAEESVPMSLLRRKIAERLVSAQHTAALLTTFNEVDVSAVASLRKEFQERFVERYRVKLGFMSFFVKATVEALKETPSLNAEIRGTNIVYRNYYDLGVAIGGGRGLVVPVLRQVERLGFAEIEQAIAGFAAKARDNKLRPDDLQGGTFTITNGGVYGSLLSTPLVNPPQSGVLGMHAIQDRPVALNGQVVIRPMMYVALTYDHRIVDGREAVTFLKRVKELIENPGRMLLEI